MKYWNKAGLVGSLFAVAALFVGTADAATFNAHSATNAELTAYAVNPLVLNTGASFDHVSIASGSNLPPNPVPSYRSPFENLGAGNFENISFYTVASRGGFFDDATLSFNGLKNKFSFLWGSPDSFNKLEFYKGATLVFSLTGTQVQPPVSVGASVVSVADLWFDSVKFYDNPNQRAFEFAGVSAVPVPAGGLLLLSALGAGALVRRRKQS